MPEAKSPSVLDVFRGKSSAEAASFLNSNVLDQQVQQPQLETNSNADNKHTSVVQVVSGVSPTPDKQDGIHFNKLVELAMKAFVSSGSSSTTTTATSSSTSSQGEEGVGDLTTLLASATVGASSTDSGSSVLQESNSEQQLSELIEIFKPLLKSLDEFFKELGVSSKTCSPEAFFYYLELEEERKTPSWKRRKHRFAPSFDIETIYALHDALYLAELSYVNTIAEIQKGIDDYDGASYELIYCTVQGFPSEPAHFICLKKEKDSPKEEKASWSWNPFHRDGSVHCLDVLFVVRGTKELGDMLSDMDWNDADYKGGKAHKGILESAKYLVNKHIPLLKRLLQESKRDKVRISLIGHSLGAGAAAIACMEFNDLDFVHHASSIGFGCPALLSKDLSESTKDYIVTVVADSDAVPRMSNATVGNLILDVMSTDWSAKALVDLELMMDAMAGSLPITITTSKKQELTNWIHAKLESGRNNGETKVGRERAIARERLPVILLPPGKCVHLYRDGFDISGCYMPCDFFNELDCSRTMLNDHYVGTGYNRMFHDLMRTHKNKLAYTFRNNVAALRVEKEYE
jgi:hypothetical protein